MRHSSPAHSLLIAAVLGLATLGGFAPARAQEPDNPDYRIRAEFRTPRNGAWGEHESVGHAEFRVKSRFGQVYYGGVIRQDEYKFSVSIDFSSISDYLTEFPGSPYNTSYDVYIEDDFVGRVDMPAATTGIGDLEYDSRHPDPPAMPLPAGFPSPVQGGMAVRVFFASGPRPAIGASLPAGTPIFESTLLEASARGDVDENGAVDMADWSYLANNFDPSNANAPHIGPAAGDFTGDNRSDLADYRLFVLNWTESTPPPSIDVAGVEDARVSALRLAPNSPNPFRVSTTLRFALSRASDVSVEFVDVTGARVARIERSALSAGPHEITFDGRDANGRRLPNGTYFYRVTAGTEVATRRMVLMN